MNENVNRNDVNTNDEHNSSTEAEETGENNNTSNCGWYGCRVGYMGGRRGPDGSSFFTLVTVVPIQHRLL